MWGCGPCLVGSPGVTVNNMLSHLEPALSIDEGESIDLGRCIAIQHSRRSVNALNPIHAFRIHDSDTQVTSELFYVGDIPAGLRLDVAAGRTPVGSALWA